MTLLDRLLNRRRSYRRLFLADDGEPNEAARVVLADLKKYCRADRPSFTVARDGRSDPYATAFAEGRRDVWNRIQAQLHLPERVIRELEDVKNE